MSLIKTVKKKLKSLDEHTLEVVKKSSASTIVKVASMAIGLSISVFLGRTIGAEGLGIINLSNRVVNVLLVFGLLGMRQVIIKEVAIFHNKKDFAHIGNIMYSAYWLNGGITLVLSVILILLSPWLANSLFHEPRLTYPLMVSLVVATPQIFSRLFSSALVGYHKIWQSNLVENALSAVITGLILLTLWILKQEITVHRVAIIYATGRVAVTVSVGIYWKTLYKYRSKRKNISKQLIKTSLPLLIITISGMIMTNADVIILAAFVDAKDLGLYTVAARIAMLTSFFLQVTNAAISPKIAILYESGKIKEMEKMVQQVTRVLWFIGLLSLFVYTFAGKYILGIWGSEFMDSYWILLILSLGQLFNIGTGAVGLILIMTGHEKTHRNISISYSIISLIAILTMTYIFGVKGTAIAVAFSVCCENLTKMYFVRKRIGINVLSIKYTH